MIFACSSSVKFEVSQHNVYPNASKGSPFGHKMQVFISLSYPQWLLPDYWQSSLCSICMETFTKDCKANPITPYKDRPIKNKKNKPRQNSGAVTARSSSASRKTLYAGRTGIRCRSIGDRSSTNFEHMYIGM